jgi:hypothetical protein
MGECLEFPKLSDAGSDDSPLIPEGVYEMGYLYHETWSFMGRQPKVVIHFKIAEPGDYFGAVLLAYYCVEKHVGKRGKAGRFKVSKKSNLYRDFCRVFPDRPAPRPDRIPLSNLSSVVVRGTIVTVSRAYDQRDIPLAAQYSRVASIEKW